MFPDGKDKIEYTSSIRKEFILTKFIFVNGIFF